MRNLIQFFIRYSVLFLFVALETTAFLLMVNHNRYQGSVVFSSANAVTARMLAVSNGVTEFFRLRATNAELSAENTALLNLLEGGQPLTADSCQERRGAHRLHYIGAHIVNLTTNRVQNYLTLDKGRKDGVRTDMGVVSNRRVVGIVRNVSEHFCVVLPIIHPESGINCRIKKNNYAGILHWDGKDYRRAQLDDIAHHVRVNVGDSVITSGFTSVFPEGLHVGQVAECRLKEGGSYYDIDVALAVDYRTLSYVEIIDNGLYAEQQELESQVRRKER